jgi:hypothetical protein
VAEILRAKILTRFSLVRSELVEGINRILRYVTWAIVPVAALVGMVPQGLVLLTSVAFSVAAVTLARRRVLVQQLPAVEGLARVDVMVVTSLTRAWSGVPARARAIQPRPAVTHVPSSMTDGLCASTAGARQGGRRRR